MEMAFNGGQRVNAFSGPEYYGVSSYVDFGTMNGAYTLNAAASTVEVTGTVPVTTATSGVASFQASQIVNGYN